MISLPSGRARSLWQSLHNPNYRLYLTGYGFSNTGLWLQITAEVWMILELTSSGVAVGIHSILRYGPILLLGAQAGVLSDRLPRRTLLTVTQTLYAICATVIAIASWMGSPTLWLIYCVVLVQGIINSVDDPLRRAFVRDLVDDADLTNAVSLQASVGKISRAAGPAVGGLLIAMVGVEWCFALNAMSYLGFLVVLSALDTASLRSQILIKRAPHQIREAVAYAWKTLRIREALLMCAVVALFAWNWSVLIPFYVTEEFNGDSILYGALLSVLSVGAIAGALMTARLRTVERRHLFISGAAVSGSLLLTAVAPSILISAVALVLLGVTSTASVVAAQAVVQLQVVDSMSGRVLALYGVVFVGSKPFGGIFGGWITEVTNARMAFGLGALAVGVVVMVIWWRTRQGQA